MHLPDWFALVWLPCVDATNRVFFGWLTPHWPEIERLLERGERLAEVR